MGERGEGMKMKKLGSEEDEGKLKTKGRREGERE